MYCLLIAATASLQISKLHKNEVLTLLSLCLKWMINSFETRMFSIKIEMYELFNLFNDHIRKHVSKKTYTIICELQELLVPVDKINDVDLEGQKKTQSWISMSCVKHVTLTLTQSNLSCIICKTDK